MFFCKINYNYHYYYYYHHYYYHYYYHHYYYHHYYYYYRHRQHYHLYYHYCYSATIVDWLPPSHHTHSVTICREDRAAQARIGAQVVRHMSV